jgi:HSP20 family protein
MPFCHFYFLASVIKSRFHAMVRELIMMDCAARKNAAVHDGQKSFANGHADSKKSSMIKNFSKMANIVKVHPFSSTKSTHNGLINEFFNRGLADIFGSDDSALSQPAVNVVENKDSFRLAVAAPGFDKKDFTISVENNYLTVEGKREAASEDKSENNERILRREFRYESFRRSFKLPNSVNIEHISAVYENGILNVELPKRDEAKPISKSIQIG